MFFCMVFVAAALGVNSVRAQSIDIVMISDNPTCSAQVGTNPFIELQVVAILGGEVSALHGAQFMVAGLPATWNQENVSWAWDASLTLAFGNPLFAANPEQWDDRGAGATIAWSTCQDPAGARSVRIGKILILGAPTQESVTLRIKPFQLHPGEPFCPIMTHCDAPVFSTTCVAGGTFVLNGTNRNCNITAVENTTWSEVKNLYQ